jgi:hypothetical protein
MSTLVPGSDPWQIAEPLEYASDIWKALEDKYGPKSEGKEAIESRLDHGEKPGRITDGEHGWEDKLTGEEMAAANDGLAQEVSDGLQEVAELWTHDQGIGGDRPISIKAQSTAQKKWNDDSMRDQRFLWALLNGGKEEEPGQAAGAKNNPPGATG